MKRLFILIFLITLSAQLLAQDTNRVLDIFPKGTRLYSNVAYAGDTLKKHLLDIYEPAETKDSYPLIIWIHGGAWMSNDKYADMSYMKQTLKAFIDSGYAVASIDYRWSTTAVFPAQMQDCNQAIDFLYKNAQWYRLDKKRFALIGFSAGGHLANLLGLSNNNTVKYFYADGVKPEFKIRVVLDFYGPSNFFTLKGNDSKDPRNPITLLLGGTVADKPDLAKEASPIAYIDKHDPPFLIVQGEKDESVNPDQSTSLNSRLQSAGVTSEVIIVPGAPHYGVMFDAENIRQRIFYYLEQYMK
ncbi:MAG TPA: alpha/beta hydrolase [Mucilaginibacter sp.]|jgi:acetyl esterase/lipase|nr:alpha/beta hydrolase [Mucilaginibacter sp.]